MTGIWDKSRRTLLAAGLALALGMAHNAFAADVTLKIDGADVTVSPDTLEQAITEANTQGATGTQYGTEVEITIGANQVSTSGTATPGGEKALYFIHGTGATLYPADPLNVGATGGFKSVKITGNSTTDKRVIGYDDATSALNPGRVMEIVNVDGTITLSYLQISGGRMVDIGSLANQTYIGGGGLFLGAASNYATIGKYPGAAAPGVFASTITLSNVDVTNNHVALTTATATEARAAIGGGAFIDASDYVTPGSPTGGTVGLVNVNFTKNTVTMTSPSSAATGSSSFGGGLRVKNAIDFNYSYGSVSENVAKTEYGSHAAGGGIVIDDHTEKSTLSYLTISKNQALAVGEGAASDGISKALGGGLYTLHQVSGTSTELELKINNTVFSENRATAQGTGTEKVDAYGGGAYLNGNTQAKFTTVNFDKNIAESQTGEARGGALAQGFFGANNDASLEFTTVNFTSNEANGATDARGGAVYSLTELVMTGSGFKENKANAVNAFGGGVFGVGKVTLKSTVFDSNTATGTTMAKGAGIYGQDTISLDENSTVYKNVATGPTALGAGIYGEQAITLTKTEVSANEADGSTTAQGGGVFSELSLAMTESTVLQNVAKGADAAGAGIYAQGTVNLDKTTLQGNSATGTASAKGGALYAEGVATIDNSAFSLNTVNNNTADAQGGAIYAENTLTLANSTLSANEATGATTAQGGAIYAENNVSLTDTSLTSNKATGATAEGGAIYMSTSSAAGGQLDIISSAADKVITISGNTVTDTGTGTTENNAIFFGGNGAVAGVLNINSTGTVNLLDPIKVEMTGANAFTLNSTGTGLFKWGGRNTFNAAGGSVINLTSGENYLAQDFTAAAEGNNDMAVNIDGTFGFHGGRDSNTAMFDFTNSSGGAGEVFDIENGTALKLDLSNELVSGTFRYLVADGFDDTATIGTYTDSDANYNTTISQTGTQIWLETQYSSIYQGLINAADPNTRTAIDSGALVEKFREMTDDERAALAQSSYTFNNATPGWIMNQAIVGREILVSGAEAARKFGLGKAGQGGGYMGASIGSFDGLANMDPSAFHTGGRVWAGYIGDFDRLDGDDGYYGYKSDRHGFIAGLNYDMGPSSSIGIYGGYTHNKTKARGISAEVESDIGHVGVIGRITPIREIPQFALFGDAGYTFGSNDSRRGTGILSTTGEFDQKYYTVGLEAEYAARFGSAFVTPFASARYVRVEQDQFDESGALASHMDEVEDDACITKLGVGLGYDFQIKSGVITPSLSVAWRHDFGDSQYNANAFYMGVANPVVYKVKSTKPDKDSADIGASIRAQLNTSGGKPLGVNVGYNLNLGKNRDNHSVFIGFDLGF